jgi:hypothetical protein
MAPKLILMENIQYLQKKGDVLVFRYLGYKVTEKIVGNSNVINVLLEQDIDALDAVIVIACDIYQRSFYRVNKCYYDCRFSMKKCYFSYCSDKR